MAQGTWGGAGDTRVFRVNVLWKRALQNCQTGFHIRDVGINTLTPEDVADAVSPWASVQFIKMLHQTDDLVAVDVTNLVTKEGFSASFSNIHGVAAGVRPPSFLTLPVSLKGSIRRRYGNGRMLWPIATMDAIASDKVSDATVALYQQAIDDMVSRFMEGPLFSTMKLVHLHPELPAHGTRPLIPATWYDITSIRLNSSVSSLRRRKVGVGS